MTDVTGGTPPTGGSEFEPHEDIAAVYAHFGAESMFSVANAAALPSSGNWLGRTLMTQDTGDVYRCVASPSTWRAYRVSALSPYNSTTVGFTGVPLMKSGKATGTTNSGGVLSHSFPAAFAAACVGVLIMPHQNSGYAAGSPPVMVESSVSASGFQLFFAGAPSTAVAVPYIAFGY